MDKLFTIDTPKTAFTPPTKQRLVEALDRLDDNPAFKSDVTAWEEDNLIHIYIYALPDEVVFLHLCLDLINTSEFAVSIGHIEITGPDKTEEGFRYYDLSPLLKDPSIVFPNLHTFEIIRTFPGDRHPVRIDHNEHPQLFGKKLIAKMPNLSELRLPFQPDKSFLDSHLPQLKRLYIQSTGNPYQAIADVCKKGNLSNMEYLDCRTQSDSGHQTIPLELEFIFLPSSLEEIVVNEDVLIKKRGIKKVGRPIVIPHKLPVSSSMKHSKSE